MMSCSDLTGNQELKRQDVLVMSKIIQEMECAGTAWDVTGSLSFEGKMAESDSMSLQLNMYIRQLLFVTGAFIILSRS